jgi:hypothetical protein
LFQIYTIARKEAKLSTIQPPTKRKKALQSKICHLLFAASCSITLKKHLANANFKPILEFSQ